MREAAIVFVRSGYNLVIFGVIFAVLSYLRTQNFKKRTGVDPWRLPPLVWALASFFIAIFGTLLSIIACATTKVAGRAPAAPRHSGYGGPSGPRGYGTAGQPGYGTAGQPGYAMSRGPVQHASTPGGLAPVPPTIGTATTSSPYPGSFPAGWHPDPMIRHQQRYWDGARWTEHVADDGVPSIDPVRAT
jgi:hypothetical protein